MKKAKSSQPGSVTKRGATAKTVEEYLAKVPEPARSTLKTMRARIRAAAPAGATEMISYGIPAFHYNGPLVWYAAFAKHCSFFPGSGSLLRELKDLTGYSISKGTLRYPLDKPLPAALVKKLVQARIAQKQKTGLAKKKKKR